MALQRSLGLTRALRAAAPAPRLASRAMSTLSLDSGPALPKKYGGVSVVTLCPGDGIGKEITLSVKQVFESLNVPVEWEEFDVSGETHGSETLFQEAMESLQRNKVGLKGTFVNFSFWLLAFCSLLVTSTPLPLSKCSL